MPNFKVLQDQPEKLKQQVYGYDGAKVIPLLTDATGRANIRPLTSADTVTVVANDLDIRPLTSTDTVTVVANDLDIRPLTSVDTVTAIVSVDHLEGTAASVTTSNDYLGTTGTDVSIWRNFSFFIENTSSTAASGTVKIQISPDNSKWVDDCAEEILAQNGLTVLFTSRYLKYARIAYKSTSENTPANLSITFQAQA